MPVHALSGRVLVHADSSSDALRKLAAYFQGLADGIDNGTVLPGSEFTVRQGIDFGALASALMQDGPLKLPPLDTLGVQRALNDEQAHVLNPSTPPQEG